MSIGAWLPIRGGKNELLPKFPQVYTAVGGPPASLLTARPRRSQRDLITLPEAVKAERSERLATHPSFVSVGGGTEVSSKSRNPVDFLLGGNPLSCDCEMEWLKRINRLSGKAPR